MILKVFLLWFVCVIANIWLSIKAIAIDKTDTGKIGDLTYKQLWDEFSNLGEGTGPFVLFVLVLSPVGTLSLLVFLSVAALKRYVKDNPDKKLL